MLLPNPNGMQLTEWCQQIGQVLGHFRSITPLNGEDWRTWGKQFLMLPGVSELTPPDPMEFDDWVPYGQLLIKILENADGTLGNQFSSNWILTQLGQNITTQIGQPIKKQ